jgi:prophage antirepressor-like protein
MSDIQLFTNELFGSVRSLEINGELWFVGKDVATCLGYVDTVNALKQHVDPRDTWGGGGCETPPPSPAVIFIDSMGRKQIQYPVWINESGLYSLIFSSKLPAAVEFKYWVTHEVLPTMRKLGFNESLQILQEELQKKEELIKYLQIQNSNMGEIATSNAVNNAEKKYLECWVITSPYIPDDHRVDAFTFDPTDNNPYFDMDSIINDFKIKNNLF